MSNTDIQYLDYKKVIWGPPMGSENYVDSKIQENEIEDIDYEEIIPLCIGGDYNSNDIEKLQ